MTDENSERPGPVAKAPGEPDELQRLRAEMRLNDLRRRDAATTRAMVNDIAAARDAAPVAPPADDSPAVAPVHGYHHPGNGQNPPETPGH